MDEYIKYSIYCGRGDGTEPVTDDQLSDFVKERVESRFDNVSLKTIGTTNRGKRQKVLVICVDVHLKSCTVGGKHIIPNGVMAIAKDYKGRFNQKTVMIEVSPVLIKFV